MARGRPSTYSDKIADEICERLSNGESLKTICADEKMPHRATVFRWLADEAHAVFRDMYTRARETQAETMAEEILEIADDGTGDSYEDEEGVVRTNHEVVARSRLRVDARKWLAAKLLPRKYGEKIEATHTGDVGLTINVVRFGQADDQSA